MNKYLSLIISVLCKVRCEIWISPPQAHTNFEKMVSKIKIQIDMLEVATPTQ